MNSLNRFRPAKQFRCLPLEGKDTPFGYVEIVRGDADGDNYQTCAALVGAFAEMNEKGRAEWLKLTGGSEITTEYPSESSGGNPKHSALYTFAKGTIMSASALLSNSSVSLQN